MITAPPRDVRTSFALWLGVVATSTLGHLVGLTAFGALLDAAGTPQDARAGAYSTLVAVVLATIAVGLVLATRMRAGVGWARWALAVLGGLYLALDIAGLFGGGATGLPGWAATTIVVLTVVEIALLAGAIILMFTEEATSWFR